MVHKQKAMSLPTPLRRALRTLGEEVATWRKLRGLTQAQLADRSDISRSTLARLERGDGGISTENLFRILRGLGILEQLQMALDPYESDVGRLRADQRLPERVRPRRLGEGGDG
jgi:transcriptional regulator with XRE-family HTH domain